MNNRKRSNSECNPQGGERKALQTCEHTSIYPSNYNKNLYYIFLTLINTNGGFEKYIVPDNISDNSFRILINLQKTEKTPPTFLSQQDVNNKNNCPTNIKEMRNRHFQALIEEQQQERQKYI